MGLWHFTCWHAARQITTRGLLRPVGLLRLTWATDLREASVAQLGLTRLGITCDRTEARYRIVQPEQYVPWSQWADGLAVPAEVLEAMHGEGTEPDHWFVSTRSALAVRERTGRS